MTWKPPTLQSEDINITTQGLSEAKEKLQYLT